MSLAASTLASVVRELEGYMQSGPMGGSPGVTHLLGGRAGATAQNAERVVWVPKKRKDVEPRRQEDEGEVCAVKWTLCEVTVYAGDYARLEQLIDGLTAALDDVLSPSAYQLPDEGDFAEPGATAAGYSFKRHVALLAPVFRDLSVQGHVATVTGSIGVTDALGDPDAEAGPSFVASS